MVVFTEQQEVLYKLLALHTRIRPIADVMDLHPTTVTNMLSDLEKLGAVRKHKKMHRPMTLERLEVEYETKKLPSLEERLVGCDDRLILEACAFRLTLEQVKFVKQNKKKMRRSEMASALGMSRLHFNFALEFAGLHGVGKGGASV